MAGAMRRGESSSGAAAMGGAMMWSIKSLVVPHALMCVTDLMQHAIDEGNRLFADTPYKDSWFIFHDHLSAWWEKEAQDYLRQRGVTEQFPGGFFDRQVRRCVGRRQF